MTAEQNVTREDHGKVSMRRKVRPSDVLTLQDAAYLRAHATAQELMSDWLEDDSVDALVRHWDKVINQLESTGFDAAAIPCRGYRDALVEHRDTVGDVT